MKLAGISVLAIVMLLGPSQTAVQSYDRYNVGGYWAEKGGNKEKALDLWKKAVELNENKPHPNGALPLNCDNVAGVLFDLKRYAEAEPYCTKAALWWEKLYSPEKQADSLFRLGHCQYLEGKYADAEPNFRKALQLYNENKKSEIAAVNTLNWLGWTQLYQGQYADAVASAEEAITRRFKANGKKTDSFLGSDYQLQGKALNLLGKPGESETSLKKAIEIYEGFDDKQDEAKQDGITATLFELGYSYYLQRKYADSESTYKKALEGYQKKSALSADAAGTLNRLGNVYFTLGRFADAEAAFARSASIYQTAGGQYLPTLAVIYSNLATTYLKSNKIAAAEEALRNCISACEKSANYDQIDLALKWESLAEVLSAQAKYAEAESIYSKSLSMLKTKLRSDDARIASNSKALAAVREKLGQAGKATASVDTVIANNTPTPAPESLARSVPERSAGTTSPSSMLSAAVALSADTLAKSDRPFRDKWALVVGIGSFKDPSIRKLTYAAQDARDFRDYLVKEAHFAPDHVRLLTDEKATRRRVMSEMGTKFLARVANPDDLVVVFFSTHGSPSQLDPRSKNYLVTYDTDPDDLFASGIEMQDILDAVHERTLTSRALLIVDACHSGAIGPGAKGLSVVGNFDADALMQGSGQLVLCSSAPDQQSFESGRYHNGVFTRKLIEALKKNGSKTKLSEAYDYLQSAVAAEVQEDHARKQTPVLKGKWNGSELTLAAPPADASKLPESVKKILEPDSTEATHPPAADSASSHAHAKAAKH